MYQTLPSFILGFHGCDRKIGEAILSGSERMRLSTNEYDWLGHGSYFWENDPLRACDYENLLKREPRRSSSKVEDPFVLGAIIAPGRCLNLLEAQSIQLLQAAHSLLKTSMDSIGGELPTNIDVDGSGDKLVRRLDCAVIETLHTARDNEKQAPFQTVPGVFQEGDPVYPGAGFRLRNHIQVCVRDTECLKGFFRPLVDFPPAPGVT